MQELHKKIDKIINQPPIIIPWTVFNVIHFNELFKIPIDHYWLN